MNEGYLFTCETAPFLSDATQIGIDKINKSHPKNLTKKYILPFFK